MKKGLYYFTTETGGYHGRPSYGPTLEAELNEDQVRRLRIFARRFDYLLYTLEEVNSQLYDEINEAICCGDVDLSDYIVSLPDEIYEDAHKELSVLIDFEWYTDKADIKTGAKYVKIHPDDVAHIEEIIDDFNGKLTVNDLPEEVTLSLISEIKESIGKSDVIIVLPDNLPFLLSEYKPSDFASASS